MENFDTSVHKDKQGGWKAATRIELSANQVLKISTYKPMAPAKGLRTQATVSHIEGGFERHVLAFGSEGDFSKTLIHGLPKRVTESVVREQHARVFTTLGFLDALKSDIRKHYEAQHQRQYGQALDVRKDDHQESGHVV